MIPPFNNIIYSTNYNGFSFDCYITNVFDDNLKYLCRVASKDPKNKWQDNYTNFNKIKSTSIFFIYALVNNHPFGFWSMERPQNLPSNVGRIMSRLYNTTKIPSKDFSTNPYFSSEAETKDAPFSRQIWRDLGEDFPIHYKHYMTLFGLDQVFFTRNYNPNRKNTVNVFAKKCKLQYNLHDKIKIYRSVPQYIYYTGNKETFDVLPDYEPEIS
jgi:hypothetical protein